MPHGGTRLQQENITAIFAGALWENIVTSEGRLDQQAVN